MNAHLLSLSTLQAAAPGVLEVVFGPDGDFEGAPRWMGPIRLTSGMSGVRYVYRNPSDPIIAGLPAAMEGDLDLRVPLVFDRLARLCARVCLKYIGATEAPVSVYVYDGWNLCGLEVHTSGVDPYKQRNFCWDGADGGGNDHFVNGERRELFDLPVEVVARPQPDPISFLRALTISLAPRITALRKP